MFVPVLTLGRSPDTPSALVWGWEFSLVSGIWWLERKKSSVTYTELVPWRLQAGFAIEELGVEVSKIKCVEEKM